MHACISYRCLSLITLCCRYKMYCIQHTYIYRLFKYLKYFHLISPQRGSCGRIKTEANVCQQVAVVVGGDNFKNKYVLSCQHFLTGSPQPSVSLIPWYHTKDRISLLPSPASHVAISYLK